MASDLVTVAQTQNIQPILFWSVVLVISLALIFFVVVRFRRWLKEDELPARNVGFTLADLREMRRTGKMTEEEFEKAKALIVATTKKSLERPQPVKPLAVETKIMHKPLTEPDSDKNGP